MKKASNVIDISPISPDAKTIQAAARIIIKGGIVCFPTSCLYGLGADPHNIAAIESIYQIKGRDPKNPILVLVKDETGLRRFVAEMPDTAVSLIKRFWPGGLTIVFKAKNTVPAPLTGHSGKIGIRVPKHPVAAALVNALDGPLTGTSANVSSKAGCSQIPKLDERVCMHVDMILDAGRLKGGMGSTVVDVTADPPVVLREGVVSEKDVFSVL